MRLQQWYSWDVPTLTLKLGPVPTIVGTIIKLGRNTCTFHLQITDVEGEAVDKENSLLHDHVAKGVSQGVILVV